MNQKKRRTLLSLLLVLILLLTSACATSTTDSDQKAFSTPPKEAAESQNTGEKKKDSSVEPLSEINQIPEDGIITKEQFETVAGKDMEVSFVGESPAGYKYTWTYDANMIQNPQDQNLLIDFNEDDLDDIKISANNANDALEMEMHGKGLICPPTLTVEIPQAWQSDACVLLKEQDGQLAKMSDVTIQSSPKAEEDASGANSGDSKDKDSNSSGSGSGESDKSDAKKKNSSEKSTQPVDIDSLTKPVAGTTTLIMTVTSIDGLCYIVGGITNQGKISQINDIAKASENANVAAGGDGSDNGSGAGAGSGGSASGSGAGGSGSGTGNSGSTGSGSNGGSGNSGSGSNGNSGSGSSGSGKSGNSSKSGSSRKSGNSGSNGNSGSSGKTCTCTISISCSTILNNMENLTEGKEEFVPGNGWILKKTKVKFSKGDSVHDVLQKVCKDRGIHMESRYTPAYNSAYVEGINQLYEFDCGELSGWMYNVNGWFPNYGCSKYKLSDGDEINWVYTCDLGKDVGDNSLY